MDLREFRATVLRLDKPEEVLRLADKYLAQMEEMGDSFVLPREHVLVKPVLEYYAGDQSGWLKFLDSIRQRLPKNRRKFHEGVQELFRTVEVRVVQAERRARIDAAVTMAVRKKLIPADYDSKMQYGRKCTQTWQLRRTDTLAKAAKAQGRKLTVEERELILSEFWREIDAEIVRGELPKP